ncbi:MAG TPA: DUF445 domain-containing protein [Mycobacteriales bacterium]|nr:DUF445 domain-containing protein [Mycobacteriales bacterium]
MTRAGAGAVPAGLAGLAALTGADQRRRADLRKMKASATGLLLLAAVGYILARRWENGGGPAVAGYLRAATEAGMVGGLADWFAVTALFRRPLGLPIPHTALIPTKKDALGASLGEFVGVNFLSAAVVGERIQRADVAGLAGRWLATPGRAERVTAELAVAARGALGVLRDEDVQAVLEQAVARRLRAVPVGPVAGRLLDQIVADQAHARLVDLVLAHAHDWLLANRDTLVGVIADQGPSWSPKFVDRRIATRVHAELIRVTEQVRADPDHPARQAADKLLTDLATALRTDPATMARADTLAAALLDRPPVRQALADLATAGRKLVLDLIDDPASELRTRTAAGLRALGQRLETDAALREKANGWLEAAAAHVVTNYRDELTRTITDTVARWDAAETTRKIELQVGRDLQYIRINGTVVGSLAGLAIHLVSQLLL